MNPESFNIFQHLLHEQSGLSLGEDKMYLLMSRLTPLLNNLEYSSLDEMAAAITQSPASPLAKAVVEAMTTNETFFFRDIKPFELLTSICVPEILKARPHKQTIRIWSAACSSGQEPYSIAMTLLKNRDLLGGCDFEIIATDISDNILQKAEAGLYNQFEIQRGVPLKMLPTYFDEVENGWQIKQNVKDKVRFRNFNLLSPMETMGTFDIIFCRNILIYLDKDTKKTVLDNLARRLSAHGYLFLGSSETIIGLTNELRVMEEARSLFIPNIKHEKTDAIAQYHA